jgi:hypothetical protein
LNLLEAFRDAEPGSRAFPPTRPAQEQCVPLIGNLAAQRYIEQRGDSDRYCLGNGCLELGQNFLRSRKLLRRARPLLEELAARSKETSHIGVMRDFEVVHLDGVVSDQLVATVSRIGRSLPLHCTALGKILLGCSSNGIRQRSIPFVATGGVRAANRAPSSIRTNCSIKCAVPVRASLWTSKSEPGLACGGPGPARMGRRRGAAVVGAGLHDGGPDLDRAVAARDGRSRSPRELGFANPDA